MRKSNRIMIKVVAILLTLVLFTSTVVSGTLAKYATYKDATTSVTFEQFGVELVMTYKTNWGDENDPNRKDVTITPTEKGDSISVTISDLMMFPGDDFPEIVRFKFVEGKTPNVPVKVTITQTLSHVHENFRIESNKDEGDSNVGNLNVDKYAMPLGFKFAAYNNSGTEVIPMGYVVDPWRLGAPSNDTNMNRALAKNLDAKFGTGVNYATNSTYVTASFAKGAALKFRKNVSGAAADINQLVFGVEWPKTWEGTEYNNSDHLREGATALDYNAMETWLCNRGRDLSVSITYTVKIEQTQ